MDRDGILLCLVGPSGGGKTSLRRRLCENLGSSVATSISVTTRAPRVGERDGVNYHFVTPERFQAMVARGEFFEWESVHGFNYGTLNRTLSAALEQGIDLLFDIDVKGAHTLKARFPRHTVVIGLVPPNLELLRARIAQRGEIKPDELERRFLTAKAEYRAIREARTRGGDFDYLVVNDNFETCYKLVESIVLAERAKLHRLSELTVGKYSALL